MLRLLMGVVLVSVLCACGGGPRGPGQREAANISRGLAGPGMGPMRPGPAANEAYVAGLDLRRKGDCPAAVERVRPVANLGPGYEGAQFALGDCMITLAGTTNTADHHEGLMWLLRAGDAGWTEAQGRLAEVYALGPADTRNLDEAAYWLALYKMGAQMPRFGFEPMPPQTLASIEVALTPAQRNAGATRAASWQKKLWIPPRTAPQVPPGEPDEGRGGGRRMRRGPGSAEG